MSAETDLIAAAQAVGRRWLVERSVKFVGGEVCAGRLLLSIPRAELAPGASAKVRDLATRFGAPDDVIARLDALQRQSAQVHLGLEPEAAGPRFKLYLEFPDAAQPAPGVVFVAAKWQRGASASFDSYLRRPTADAESLVREILPPGAVRDMMLAFAPQAGGVLEVLEEHGPRRSVDLNLADRSLTVADRLDVLSAGFGGALTHHLQSVAGDMLGHVAAGSDRKGRAFATLYHGARELRAAAA